jgi:hypothetical protein
MATEKKKVTRLDAVGLEAFGEHLLQGPGRPLFLLTDCSKTYLAPIESAYDALTAAAPEAVADEDAGPTLAEARATHNDLGQGLWHSLAGVAALPLFTDEVKAAARRVKAALGEAAPNPRMSSQQRIERAVVVRRELAGLGAELARLPAAPNGETYAVLLGRWCDQGRDFARWLVEAQVAATKPAEARESSGTLVSRLTGLLTRARAALRDEVRYRPALPRTLEQEVFGLYDTLLAERQERVAAEARRAARREASDPA